jgi:hypothetical protein
MPTGGLIAHVTAKCGGNVHDKGAVEITASSVFGDYAPRNAAELVDRHSLFRSEKEPGQWSWFDFNGLRIEPAHYTLWTWH